MGFGSRISFVFAVDIRPSYFHAVVADVAGLACADNLIGICLVDTVPLRWVPLRCRIPCRTPFAENVGFWVAETFAAVVIVSIAGGWSAVPVIYVLGPLGVPVIAVEGGALVVHACSCSGAVLLSDMLASAGGVVVASTSR